MKKLPKVHQVFYNDRESVKMVPIMQEVMSFEEQESGNTTLQIEPISSKDQESLLEVKKLCAKLEKVENIKGLEFLPKL